MASDNVQGGCALANELGPKADETSRQHADRLLDAKRCGVSMDPAPTRPIARPNLNADALDQLEKTNEELGYVKALCRAIEHGPNASEGWWRLLAFELKAICSIASSTRTPCSAFSSTKSPRHKPA